MGGSSCAVLAVVVVVCAAAGAVLGLVSWQQERRAPPAVTALVERSGAAAVELAVVGDPTTGQGPLAWQQEQVRVRVVLLAVHDARGRHEVRVPALLSGDQAWADARWGERHRVLLRLSPAPVGAPYAVFAAAAGPTDRSAEPAWWWRGADRLRAGLMAAATADGTSDAAVLLPGLVVGDTSAQPADLVDDMRTAGLAHLSAVSGANVTIVCGGVLLLAVLLRLRPRAAVLLAALALLALVVVARPEPSVLRAAAMGSVGLLGVLLGRRGGGTSALSLAVVVLLLTDPWLAHAPGFRLSVAATAALVVLTGPWSRALGRLLPRPAALALAVPAAAQVAVTPMLVGLDDAVSLYALPANVLAAPAVAPATVLGLVAACASLLHPGAAAVVALPALGCTAWIGRVARTAADLPAAALPWPDGVIGVLAAVLAPLGLVALAAVTLRVVPDRREPGRLWAPWPRPPAPTRRPATPPGSPRRPLPSLTTVVGAVLVAVLITAWWAPCGAGEDPWPGTGWAVAVCDVGQGESVLLRAGPDSAVVVDSGPEAAPVADCLRRAGVRTVPLLVLTHLHADHVGGLEGIASQAVVQRVWTAPAGMPTDAEARLQGWADQAGVVLERPVAGQAATVGQAQLEVVAPPASARDTGPGAGTGAAAEGGSSQDVNDAGLVVRVRTGGLTVLAVGDIGSEVQQRLLASGAALQADVTTVAHHGSADQLPAFWAAVGARVAVASAGRDNTYGHPSPRTLGLLTDVGAVALSTAVHGDVAIRPAGPGPADADGPDPADPADPAGASLAVRTTRAAPRRPRRVPRGPPVRRRRGRVPA